MSRSNLIAQDETSTSQNDALIRNCFFLWTSGLVLLLTAMPVVSQMLSVLFRTPLWTLPKIYELKLYSAAMMVCLVMPLITKYVPALFSNEHPRYKLYALLYYPSAVLFYSLPLPGFIRCLCVLFLTFIGIAILIYDLLHSTSNHISNTTYNRLLIASVSLSVLLIICNSSSNAFGFFSILTLVIFILFFIMLRFVTIQNKYPILLVPILLYIVTFGAMQGAMEVTHYSFFLGPVIEILYGHFHPLEVDIQYGGGLTTFLALYFKSRGVVSFSALYELLKTLTLVQYCLIFFIAGSLYRSYKIAFLALLAILSFNFFAPNIKYYYCAPSSGFLRFGFAYLILICYSLENKALSARSVTLIISILTSIAVLWSFESAIYTLPAVLFAEYINKNLRRFLAVFLCFFCIITALYLSPFIMKGSWPPIWRYSEYAMSYANGFGQIPLDRLTNFWWLFPLLYGYFLIKIMSGDISNKLVCMLTVYGMAIFTYFAGRSHPIGLNVVSIPFILLAIYFILQLKTPSTLVKQALLASLLAVFPSAYYVLDSNHTIMQGVWGTNLPLMRNFFSSGSAPAFLLSDSGSPWLHTTDVVENGCAEYAPLKQYIVNNALAIISTDDKNLLGLYACTKSHNALMLNPYYETALNPKAVARMSRKVSGLKNGYLLVESNLLKKNVDLWGSNLTAIIVKQLHAAKIGSLIIHGESIDIFQVKQ